MAINATSKDYWISPSAIHVELNALGNPDYIQASCVSGAQILVYVKGVIGYDDGHNYRRWALQAAPTVFNSHSEKYVYAAIPRNNLNASYALLVFPSEPIDIYGKNAELVQVGSEKYYYVFLQGIISSSGDNGAEPRKWTKDFVTGYLSSDEAIAARPNESEWYQYSTVNEKVTFLKDLTMKEGTSFVKFFSDSVTILKNGSLTFEGQNKTVTGIATADSPVDSESELVVPKFLQDKYLCKYAPDATPHALGVGSLVSVGDISSGGAVSATGPVSSSDKVLTRLN